MPGVWPPKDPPSAPPDKPAPEEYTIGDPDEQHTAPPVTNEKLERMRFRSKWLSTIAGLVLTAVAVPSCIFGSFSSCDAILVRTIMGWMSIFGLLIALAELARYRLFKMSQRDKKTTASNSTKGKSTEMV
ncbi:MAG: hypothetical protein SGPRY_003134 [Prymnesium sp.]